MTPPLIFAAFVGLPFAFVVIRFAVREQARVGREIRADLFELEATRTAEQPELVHLITDLQPADDYAPISPDLFDRHERR